MQFDFDFYSSILLIFFVHTFVYSILFFYRYKKKEQPSSLWMGIFLMLAALYISPWMLGFAGWYGHQPYRDIMFYVPFQHLFLIGPVIFFYVSSLFNPKFRLTQKDILHFLPAILYGLFCIVMFVYDQLIVGRYYFLKAERDPDFDNWYQITGYLSIIFYFIISIKYYYQYKKAIESVMSNAADFLFIWVRNFLFSFLLILFSWLCVAVFGLFYDINFNITWWYFLAFAICCYYIAIAGYSNAVEAKIFFKTNFFNSNEKIYFLSYLQPRSLAGSNWKPEQLMFSDQAAEEKIFSAELVEWKSKIEILLMEELIYQQPELSLFDIAKKLNTNISFLSMVINRSFGTNFNDLINSYRVSHFINLLKKGEHKTQTLLSLAFDSGFNSKTTFNRAFKKHTGYSPQDYIKKKYL